MKPFRRPLLSAATTLAIVIAVPAAAHAKGPLVFAAASLQESLTDVAQAWADQGHAAPVLSFAASSALARQVEQGAPADLFVSADEEWMDYLDKRSLIEASNTITK